MYILLDLLVLGCINGMFVVGLNLHYGYAGILNFAIYTYVAIGAYVGAVTTLGRPTYPGTTYILGWHLPWYVGILLGGLAAAAVGSVIFAFTVRRLRSDYQAIVTVSLGFIVWNIINSYTPLFDGATGVYGVPYITGGAHLSIEQYSLVMAPIVLVILGIFVLVSRLVFRSPYGRLLRAIREDEAITSSCGRTSWPHQLSAFMLGCFMAGVGGAFFVFYITAWTPSAFLNIESFFVFAALMIGGAGNYWGALLGAFVVIEGLNEATRYFPTVLGAADVGAVRAITIGVVLILIMRYRPEGLLPERWLRWYSKGRPASNREPGLTHSVEHAVGQS